MSSPRSISGSYTERKSPTDGCDVRRQLARRAQVVVEGVEVGQLRLARRRSGGVPQRTYSDTVWNPWRSTTSRGR